MTTPAPLAVPPRLHRTSGSLSYRPVRHDSVWAAWRAARVHSNADLSTIGGESPAAPHSSPAVVTVAPSQQMSLSAVLSSSSAALPNSSPALSPARAAATASSILAQEAQVAGTAVAKAATSAGASLSYQIQMLVLVVLIAGCFIGLLLEPQGPSAQFFQAIVTFCVGVILPTPGSAAAAASKV
jgi:hypothetical protein